ncbi:MAG: ArnT family glycosyltransferase [Anaerolineae bacterium]
MVGFGRTLRKSCGQIALALLLLVGLGLRLYGLNWDEDHLFHPDERWILLVVDELALPPHWASLLSPNSPLNPHFFAYGSLPLYLLKGVAHLLSYWREDLSEFSQLHLVGRALSALFDTGTIFLVYRLGKKLYERRVGFLAAAFVAFTVLHIQLSHFYAVDTLLAFFIVLAVTLAEEVMRRGSLRWGAALGASIGLALATKVSALPLLLTALAAWMVQSPRSEVRSLKGRFLARPGSLRQAQDNALRQGSGQAPDPGHRRGQFDFAHYKFGNPLRAFLDPLKGRLGRGIAGTALTTVVAGLVFLLGEPYALIDWVEFLQGVLQESWMVQGLLDAPYTLQYVGTPAYIYPVQQAILWSMGLPLGLVAFGGFAFALITALRQPCGIIVFQLRLRRGGPIPQGQRRPREILLLSWALPYFLITGGLQVKYLRYMLPLTPFLCLMGAHLLISLLDWMKREQGTRKQGISRQGTRKQVLLVYLSTCVLASFVLFSTILYSLAFLYIYTQRHPWLQASEWIYRNVPPGTTLAIEHWDHPLPVRMVVDGRTRSRGNYLRRTLELYKKDDARKLAWLVKDLLDSDYIILASNRLYGSIPRVPERYPLTSRYYRLLLGGELGFRLVHFEATYPRLLGVALVDDTFRDPPLPVPAPLVSYKPAPLTLNLGRADESFTVYDHPKPLIFKKERQLSEAELRRLLGGTLAGKERGE